MIKNEKISNNFWVHECLKSDTATRQGGKMLEEQMNPSPEKVENIKRHIKITAQPARDFLQAGISILSGIRGLLTNKAVGGSKTSEHVYGHASDQELANSFLDSEKCKPIKEDLDCLIKNITTRSVRADVNATFYLFAYYCLFLNRLDVNQVIHEYGEDGAPAWVHVSSSNVKDKRQILIKRKSGYAALTLKQALMLGC